GAGTGVAAGAGAGADAVADAVAGASFPKRPAKRFGPEDASSAGAGREEDAEDPPRDSDGGISPGLRVATEGLRIDEELEPDPAVVEGFEGVGAGRSARRFFASSVSIERPSFSTCSASAARSASSSWAGSTV